MKMKIFLALAISGWMALNNYPVLAQESPATPFLGMWALDLGYSDNNAGWMELRQEEGYLDAEVLWRWGGVYAIDFPFIDAEQLILTHGHSVVRKRDENGKPVRVQYPVHWFQVEKDGEDRISGTAYFPDEDGIGVEAVKFTGKRIPPAGNAPKIDKAKLGDPVKLFNGRDLDGWELLDPNAANGWKVKDGVLINDPVQKEGEKHVSYGNLRTKGVYEDFHLNVEVNVPQGSNSGVYLRGIYEVQVMDSYGKPLDPHNMGALYSRITPSVAAEKPAGEWQKLGITLYKRHLTVELNGTTIIDNQPVKGVTGGALTSDEFSPGPIYLQGDHGRVSFRNIVLTPIME